VNYEDGVLDWTLDLLDTPLTILNYNLQSDSISHTRQFNTHALGLLSLLSLHQSYGTGFQLRTFSFLSFRTLSFSQPQRLIVRSPSVWSSANNWLL
jgi:hypothetical protein